VIVKRVECDNPFCRKTGIPESDKPYRPPYGWLTMKGSFFGSGPSIKVEVCSVECLEKAVNQAAKEASDER